MLWVAGGGRGIGAGLARKAAATGAHVVVSYREDTVAARRLAQSLPGSDDAHLFLQGDLRNIETVREMASAVKNRFGRLDYIANCTHWPLVQTPIEEVSWSELHDQFLGTVGTSHHVIQVSLPLLLQSEQAGVLNVSSATVGRGDNSFAARNIAKAALDELTRIWATALGSRGIRVNVLSLGWTETDQLACVQPNTVEQAIGQIPLGRFATVDEVADFAWCLLHRFRYVSGATLPFDGGYR